MLGTEHRTLTSTAAILVCAFRLIHAFRVYVW